MIYNNSERVKRWRNNTKKRIVESMGGKCIICGYNKCNRALNLHHLNPDDKEFGFGRIMASPKSWKKIVSELRKCVLLCCRCHEEVHDGITLIPEKSIGFDENFKDYKIKKEEFDECPICGNLKKIYNKTCSHNCASKLSRRVDWDNVNLKKMIEDGLSYNKIGSILKVSGTAVKKRAKKLRII